MHVGFIECPNCRVVGGYVDRYSHQPRLTGFVHEDASGTIGSHVSDQNFITTSADANAGKNGRQGAESEPSNGNTSRSLNGKHKAGWRGLAWLLQSRAWRSDQSQIVEPIEENILSTSPFDR